MKFVIVLFAVVVAASAYPGIYHAPVAQPWPAAPAWPAPAPTYVKAIPIVKQVHAPAVHHVSYVQQQPPIPPLHPQPLNIKAESHSVRLPYAYVKPAYPHLIGYEAQVPEPQIKIVKAPVGHHPWA